MNLHGDDLDERISKIFYYFESMTTVATGRTVGRKIGVVQEFMLRTYLEDAEPLKRRLYLEQGLTGRSGAAHKVEFSWYALQAASVTTGQEIPGTDGLVLSACSDDTGLIKVQTPSKLSGWLGTGLVKKSAVNTHLATNHKDIRIRSVENGVAHLDVIDKADLIASLESKRVGAQRFAGSDKLGSGIQTIEKAKQASLVAIDLDLKYNGSVKPLQAEGQKRLISMVALGNGVHWTAKDKAVLGTYVDFTFLVKDDGIIRYADFVAELLPDGEDFLEFFMDYFKGMTKQDPDDFEVVDTDFEIIVPEAETRTLKQVLVDHVETVNPV